MAEVYPHVTPVPAAASPQLVQPGFAVKAAYGAELRRFTVCPPTYEALMATVRTTFGLVAAKFTYVDEDGDTIIISSQPELDEALRHVQNSGVLRLQVHQPIATVQPPIAQFETLSISSLDYRQVPVATTAQPATCEAATTSVPPEDERIPLGNCTSPQPSCDSPKRCDSSEFSTNWKREKIARRLQRWNEKADKIAQKLDERKDKFLKRLEKKKQRCAAYFTSSNPEQAAKSKPFASRFVKHVTFEDDSWFPPGTPFTKVWRLRNEGTMAWPDDTHLVFISKFGDRLGAPEKVFVGAIEVGLEVDVPVPMIAPENAGHYCGFWRLYSAKLDRKFGQRIWARIYVISSSSSSDEERTDATGWTNAGVHPRKMRGYRA